MTAKYKIIHEDNMIIAADKPAGLLSQGDRSGDENLLGLLKSYLKKKYKKEGNVFLGLVHRLDRNTSGVICFARNSKAAARLSEQFRTNSVERVYHVVAKGVPDRRQGILKDKLSKNAEKNIVTASDEGKEAALEYKVLKAGDDASLLEVKISTGRPHQIRVQLANAGLPVYGDQKYGAETPLIKRPAVHAKSLEITHPVNKTRLKLEAEWPDDFRKLVMKII